MLDALKAGERREESGKTGRFSKAIEPLPEMIPFHLFHFEVRLHNFFDP